MPCVDFSISRPMTSGINLVVSCGKEQLEASRWMISTIFFRIARICEERAYVVFLIWFGLRFVNAMANMRSRYSSVVLTVTLASISVCHLRTNDRSLSEVKSSPWKFVRQFFPWTSSTLSCIFRKAWSSSFWRSASETSKILPFNASFAFLRPVVRFTKVFPTLSRLRTSRWRGPALNLLADLKAGRSLVSMSQRSKNVSIKAYLDWIPILSSKWVLRSLLETLLALREAFISARISLSGRGLRGKLAEFRFSNSLANSHGIILGKKHWWIANECGGGFVVASAKPCAICSHQGQMT